MCAVVLYIASLQCKHLFKSFAELDPFNGLPKHYFYCEKKKKKRIIVFPWQIETTFHNVTLYLYMN